MVENNQGRHHTQALVALISVQMQAYKAARRDATAAAEVAKRLRRLPGGKPLRPPR